MAATKNKNVIVGLAVACFAVGMASVPFLITKSFQKQGKSLTNDKNALPGQVVIRGAFVNSGSRDAGPDPDWDPITHTWKGRKNLTRRKDVERAVEEKAE